MTKKRICLAITGASGFQYGLRLLQVLLQNHCEVNLLISDAAREVARLEADILLPQDIKELHQQLLANLAQTDNGLLKCFGKTDWLSPVASGSSQLDAMVVCPCSTGTLSSIANGQSNNLIERAATVCLKENRTMIIVPREMPLSAIQLEHMHKLALMGVKILPASPGFYQKPSSIDDIIDFVVARILMQLGLPQKLLAQWGLND